MGYMGVDMGHKWLIWATKGFIRANWGFIWAT